MTSTKRPPNATVTLPSGVVVDFFDEIGVNGLPQQRRYLYGGEKFVSISTVSNVYDKPALPFWAGKTNVEGLLAAAAGGADLSALTVQQGLALLSERGLDWQSVRDRAGQRGDAAHTAFLALLRDQKVPVQGDYRPEHWQHIRAGVRWAIDFRPTVIDMETIVASVEHKVAGRYDFFGRIKGAPPGLEHLIGLTGRVDFKTVTEWKYAKARADGSRDLLPPYPEHLSQVEGYELCAVESGYEPSDFRAVVRLGPDGEYDMTESWATADHFLGDVASYRNRQSLNVAKPRKPRARRQAVPA